MEVPAQPTVSWQMLLAPSPPSLAMLSRHLLQELGAAASAEVWGGTGNSMVPQRGGFKEKKK